MTPGVIFRMMTVSSPRAFSLNHYQPVMGTGTSGSSRIVKGKPHETENCSGQPVYTFSFRARRTCA